MPIKEIFSTSYVGDDQNKCVYNIMMIFARWRAKSLCCAAAVCLLQTARMMIFVRMCQTYNTDIKNNIICSMLVFARRRRFCFLLVAGILLRHALITARNKYIILMIIFDLTRTQKKAGIIERAEQAPHGGRFFVGFLGAVLRIIGTSPYYPLLYRHVALSSRCFISALFYRGTALSSFFSSQQCCHSACACI